MTCYRAEKEDLEQRGAGQREPETAKILTGYRTKREECKNSDREPDRERRRKKIAAMDYRAEREERKNRDRKPD